MSSILEKINSPSDVKNLTGTEKNILCGEIRSEIINTVSQNGGHLASNLGVVELAVAIMSVFDPPKDTIVWDVGHQIYAHKLLTGRYRQFAGIRTYGGLSGFPSRQESECDPFTTGHSSTSISSALGVAVANSLKDEEGCTVVVIGDGSLTGGLAFEGLNNAGRLKKNFIVILNDNEMAISKNVGSMAKYLGYIRTKPGYLKAKNSVEHVVGGIPVIGRRVAADIKRVKDRVKRSIYTSTIFEDMGFSYYGPFDGHDLTMLTETLKNARVIDKPILIHVRTVKGKGYNYAETKPNVFHGVGGFNTSSGKLEPSKRSFSSVFGRCLCNMAYADSRICAVTAAMCEGTGLVEFSRLYKNRFFDVGIAEEHAVTFAGGLASKGMIPFFAVYSTFLQRAYDNMIHDVALQGFKVILGVDRAGVVGEDGRTHHGVFDVAYLRTIPGITVFSPSFFAELDTAMQRAVSEEYSLVAIRYPRGHELYHPVEFEDSRKDFDVYGDRAAENAIVTYGRVFSNCVLAVNSLEKKGIKVKIIKLNKIIPLCPEAISEAMGCKHILFVEEGVKSGGVSEAFATSLYEQGYRGRIRISAIENGFVPHGSMNQLLQLLKLDQTGIEESFEELLDQTEKG